MGSELLQVSHVESPLWARIEFGLHRGGSDLESAGSGRARLRHIPVNFSRINHESSPEMAITARQHARMLQTNRPHGERLSSVQSAQETEQDEMEHQAARPCFDHLPGLSTYVLVTRLCWPPGRVCRACSHFWPHLSLSLFAARFVRRCKKILSQKAPLLDP